MQFQSCTETIQFPFAQPVLSTILRRQKMAHEKTNSILNHCAANWTFTIRMGYGSLLTLFLLIGKPPKLWNDTEQTENSSSNLNGHLKVIWLSGAGEYVSGPLRCTFFLTRHETCQFRRRHKDWVQFSSWKQNMNSQNTLHSNDWEWMENNNCTALSATCFYEPSKAQRWFMKKKMQEGH